jgi:hypothetical protein
MVKQDPISRSIYCAFVPSRNWLVENMDTGAVMAANFFQIIRYCSIFRVFFSACLFRLLQTFDRRKTVGLKRGSESVT